MQCSYRDGKMKYLSHTIINCRYDIFDKFSLTVYLNIWFGILIKQHVQIYSIYGALDTSIGER